MVDNNTWNINHLATIGRAMSSYEDELCEIMKSLDVDWSMIAKASPCYVTYLKDSMDQILNCFESNVAVSEIIALETIAAVQMRIDEANRVIQRKRSWRCDIGPPQLLDSEGLCSRSTKLHQKGL
ncbi:hypothetical protein F0562_013332 [Nyssa sinensis]|uniref:Uncharacterized protein n=1 Tax=Nyssa sinensis TaxID=561372 RepID=A0A5J4ZN19_9ASTE|nr:hypothetical protein F0562_013332 [Nyssa sinensis]